MGTLNLGTGAQFVGTTNGLSDAPTGTIIQTAINGTTNNITANSDGSYSDLLSLSFTPRQSNSKIIFSIMFNAYYHNGSSGTSQGASYRFLRDSTSIKELLTFIPLYLKKLLAIAPPIKISEQEDVKDRSVFILVETFDPPMIANFFFVDFFILSIAKISLSKLNPGADNMFLAI